MDCHKAKLLLNSTDIYSNKELLEHVENCAECSREFDAARLLNKAFQGKNEESKDETTPLNIIQSKIEKQYLNQTKKERGIMAQIREQVSRRPKLAAGFVMALAVFMFITLVPFSYTRIAGYEVAFSNVGDIENEKLMKIDQEMASLGYDDISIKINNSGIYISDVLSRKIAEEVAILVSSVIGKTVNSQIKTITEAASGSLYAQVSEKRKTIEIHAKGKTSDEIKDEIRRKLIAEGFSDSEIIINKSGDSLVDIYVKMKDSGANKMQEGVIELKVSADADSFEIPVIEDAPEELDIDMEGKTDAEIKALIKEKLASEGKEGAKVEVITNSDGEKEIKVEMDEEVIK